MRNATDRPSQVLSERAAAERRRHLRHDVSVAVVVAVGSERYECRISNVGSGGAYLTPSLDIPVGGQVKLQPLNARICAMAGVRRVESDGVGVAFDDDTLGAIVAGWSRRVQPV